MFCWLSSLSKWGVGPFKRGSHLSSSAGLESLTVQLLSRKTRRDSAHKGTHLISMGQWTVFCQLLTLSVLYIQSISPSRQCDKLDNYYFAICTHGPNSENELERTYLARCWEVVNNSVKGFHPMTSREYFHEIFSRFRIINPHACSVPEQQHAMIIYRLSVSAEIITATVLLKKDERLHLDWWGGF